MMRTPHAILAAAALLAALAACSEEAPETTAAKPQPEARSTPAPAPAVNLASLPPIPTPEIERINELPVREELATFRQRAVDDPANADAIGNFGMKCFVYDFDNEAVACFERAAALAPDALPWRYFLAMSYENAGEADKAIASYERAVEIEPTYQPAYVRMGLLLLDVDREKACFRFDQANRIAPDEARSLWGLAQCARLDGDLEYAESLYRDAIKSEPAYAEAHFGLAQVLAQTGRRDEAQRHFALQQAGRAASDYRDPLAVRLALAERGTSGIQRDATALMQRGQLDRAINMLLDALEDYPSHPGLLLQLAQIRMGQQNFTAARELIEQVRANLPDNVGALSMLAVLSIQEQKLDEAEALLREAVRLNPDDPVSNWYLGQLLNQTGRADEAMPYLTRGAELQTFTPNIQVAMSQIHAQRGEYTQAAACLRRAAIASGGNEQYTTEADRLEALASEQDG